MNVPTVTVITPTYNREALLAETVDSVLGQRFADFEYIVVDDGSTDDTRSLLAAYRDPRLVVLRQRNRGEVAATNRGWAKARGRHVVILSSDDPVHPLWLGEMVKALDAAPDAVVAYPDWRILDERGETKRIMRTFEYDAQTLATMVAQPGPGALIRKSAGDRLTPPRRAQFRYCADLDMWLRLSLLGPFVRVPKVLATWRDHPGSISSSERTHRRADELVALATEFFARSDLPPAIAALGDRGVAGAHKLAAWVLHPTDPAAADAHLAQANALLSESDKATGAALP